MSDSNLSNQNSNVKVITNNVIIKHYVKGMSRFLILWIIKYKGPIHGYAILKELGEFFSILIKESSLKKSNPSNFYSILNGMEENNLITSKFKVENNKKLKYFEITEDGVYVLNYMYSRFNIIHNNPQWKLLFETMNDCNNPVD